MAGCFGSSAEDRYREAQLLAYLEETELDACERCGCYIEECECDER